jgi:hypothetical protein
MCDSVHQIYAASLQAPLQLSHPTLQIFLARRLSEAPLDNHAVDVAAVFLGILLHVASTFVAGQRCTKFQSA